MYISILFLLTAILPFATLAQTTGTDTLKAVTLGDSTFAVPEGCIAGSPYQLQCDDYQMAWLYFPHEQVNTVLESTLGSMEKNLPNFRKEKTSVYLFGEKRDGYRVYFTKDDSPIHQLITYGPLGKFSAIVQVVMYYEIKSDTDLPEFARQIMRLSPRSN